MTITGVAAGRSSSFGEDAAGASGNSQNAEVVAADNRAFHRAGRPAATQHGLAERKIAHREQSVQHFLAGRHLPVQGIADVDRLIVFKQLHLNQRGRAGHRQRAEDNRVEYLINRGIGADAESERKHRGHGEGRIVTQLAEGVNHVLPQGIHQPEYGARSVASQRERSTRKDNGYKYQYF